MPYQISGRNVTGQGATHLVKNTKMKQKKNAKFYKFYCNSNLTFGTKGKQSQYLTN